MVVTTSHGLAGRRSPELVQLGELHVIPSRTHYVGKGDENRNYVVQSNDSNPFHGTQKDHHPFFSSLATFNLRLDSARPAAFNLRLDSE
jgi:hypothetical protein